LKRLAKHGKDDKITLLNQIILDPFMASFTTGDAALTLGRIFIGMKLDEYHFELTKLRNGLI